MRFEDFLLNPRRRWVWAAGIALVASAAAVHGAAVWTSAVYDARTTVETPHIAWAKPHAGGAVRILAIGPYNAQRETAELAQRLSAECTPLMTPLRPEDSFGDRAAVADLTNRLAGFFDVILVSGPVLQFFPREAVDAFAQKIRGGTGLVCIQPAESPVPLWQALGHLEGPPAVRAPGTVVEQTGGVADELAEDLSPETAWRRDNAALITNGIPLDCIAAFKPPAVKPGTPPSSLVAVYRHGKGRAVLLRYDSKAALLLPPIASDLLYEYGQSLAIKATLWAAGRDPEVRLAGVRPPSGATSRVLNATLVNSGPARNVTVSLAVRTERNLPVLPAAPRAAPGLGNAGETLEPVHSDSRLLDLVPGETPVSFTIPPLPAGDYFMDLEIATEKGKVAWATVPWRATSAAEIAAIDFEPAALDLARTNRMIARINLRQTAGPATTLSLALVDNHNRVLRTQDVAVTAGSRCAVVEIPVAEPMSTLYRLRAALSVDRQVVDVRTGEFTVYNRPWPLFTYFAWSCGSADDHLSRQVRRLAAGEGMDAAYSGVDLDTLRVADVRAVGSVVGRPRPSVEPGMMAITQCPSDPAYRDANRQAIRTIARGHPRSDAFGYTTGDESGLVGSSLYGACNCEQCTVRLQAYARTQYRDIQALNAEWGTAYKDFSEVRGFEQAEPHRAQAMQNGNWSARIDQWLFNYRAYMDWFRFLRETTGYYMPGARFGIQTTCFFGHERGYDFPGMLAQCDFASPYGPWSWPPFFDCVRAFARPGTIFGGHLGQYQDPGTIDADGWRQNPYGILLRGGANAWLYSFATGGSGEDSGGVSPFLSLYPHLAAYGGAVRDIKAGVGELFLHSHRETDPVAIYYSTPNIIFSTAVAGPRHINSIARFSEALYELGLQGRILDRSQVLAGALDKQGIRVLLLPTVQCAGDDEAAVMRAFVERGGLVVADFRPGIADGHGRIVPSTGLPKLFGLRWNDRLIPGDRTNALTPLVDFEGAISCDYNGFAVNNLKVKGATDSALVPAGARPLATVGGTPLLTVNETGRGAAICMNMPMNRAVLNMLLSAGGVTSLVVEIRGATNTETEVSGWPYFELARFADGPAQYLGLLCQRAAVPDQVRIRLPGRKHIYAVGGGYLGEHDAVEVSDMGRLVKLIAVLPYRGGDLQAVVDAGPARPGGRIEGTVTVDTGGTAPVRHVIRMQVRRPDGQEVRYLAANLETVGGKARFAIPLALNEPVGRWELLFRDVATGKEILQHAEVKGSGQEDAGASGGFAVRLSDTAPVVATESPGLGELIKDYPRAGLYRRLETVDRIAREKVVSTPALLMLVQMARDPDPVLSWSACRVLTEFGEAASAAAADIGALLRTEGGVRITALQTLRKLGEEGARKALPDTARCLASADPGVRFEALLTIAAAVRVDDLAVRDRIAECYRRHDEQAPVLDCNLLAAYLKALAAFPPAREGAPIYGRALTGFPLPIVLTREEADTVGRHEMSPRVSYYEKILGLDMKNNYEYRLAAAKALEGLGPEATGAVSNIVAALEDLFVQRPKKDSQTRMNIWLNLVPDDQPQADDDYKVARQLCVALGAIGPGAKAALPALRRVVREYPFLAEPAEAAIEKIDPSGAASGDLDEVLKEVEK